MESKYFDHTILKADAGKTDIDRVIDEAIQFQFASVCVNSCWAVRVADKLADTGIHTCCVVGFPLGAMSSSAKAFEAKQAVLCGADEIDMVMNVGELKAGQYEAVAADIRLVKENCGNALLKVIIETCLLTEEEKVKACRIAVSAGADFVKTSTGFSTGGATIEDVKLLRQTVDEFCDKLNQPRIKVKASGGIRDKKTALAMIEAGADRLGTSATVAIMKED